MLADPLVAFQRGAYTICPRTFSEFQRLVQHFHGRQAADIFNTVARKCVGRACLAFAGGTAEILGATPTSKSGCFHGFHALQLSQHLQCSLLHVYCTSLNFNRIAQDMQACLGGRCQKQKHTQSPRAQPGAARTPALRMDLQLEVITLGCWGPGVPGPPVWEASESGSAARPIANAMMTPFLWAVRGQVEPGSGST